MSENRTTTKTGGDGAAGDTATNEQMPAARAAPQERYLGISERLGSQAIVYVIFIAIIIYFAVAAPSFATGSSVANIGRQTAAITIVAVGMTFVLIAAAVYFFVVVPMNAVNRRRQREEAAAPSAEVALLAEIRDLLSAQQRG